MDSVHNDRLFTYRVTPFGHPGINGCLLLPQAYRSLPRPSSPDGSQASTMDPFSLDHISSFPFPCAVKEQAITGLEVWGLEPQTSSLQSWRSSQLSYTPASLLIQGDIP